MKTLQKSEQELHEKFVTSGANVKTWMRKCVLLLPEINRCVIWQKKGFGSIYEYAAKLAGMSRNTVDDALRILEKIEDKPALRMVVESKGLGAVRPVVTMVTSENEMFWARKAAAMSKNTLETYVREYRKQGEVQAPAPEIDSPNQIYFKPEFRPGTEIQSTEESELAVKAAADTLTLSMTLDRETADMLLKLKGQGNWNTLIKELLQLREEKLKAEEPESVTNAKRYIPAHIKHHVLAKTNGQCIFPGCIKPHKILHHTQRFALEKVHDPKRLMPLCKGHEQMAHQGLIEDENNPPKYWQVRATPDFEKSSYAIDKMVMRYRKPGYFASSD